MSKKLQFEKLYKHLGVYTDNRLRVHEHIIHVVHNAFSTWHYKHVFINNDIITMKNAC